MSDDGADTLRLSCEAARHANIVSVLRGQILVVLWVQQVQHVGRRGVHSEIGRIGYPKGLRVG